MPRSEQMQKRLDNRNLLLQELHFHGPLSRSEIAACCKIRKSSVTGLVAQLLREGVVSELETGKTRSRLRISGREHYVLTGSIAEDALHLARVTLDGQLTRLPGVQLPDRDPESVLAAVRSGYEGFSAPGCMGFGLAFPGILDETNQTVIASGHRAGWSNFALGRTLRTCLGAPVWLVNAVQSQMLACNWFRRDLALRSSRLYLAVDHTVSCRLTLRGGELTGEHGAAGEIGHIRMGREGRRCSCGKVDCLDCYCSIPALSAAVNAFLPGHRVLPTAEGLRLAAEQDQRVRNVLDHEAVRLAEALVPLFAAVDPGCLLVATEDDALSQILATRLRQLLSIELAGTLPQIAPVIAAPAIADSMLLGAAVPAIRQLFLGDAL